MIYALASQAGAFGIADYLKTDGLAVAHLITVLTYEQVFADGSLPMGSYLFTGLDALTETETELVVVARQSLAAASPSTFRLNDPTRWLRRGALLQAAFDTGINTFRATRATDIDRRRRFPVFVRSESEHTGSLSPLLHDHRAVLRALLAALIRGHRLRDLLIVEYCHTADAEGVFGKYAAMVIGPHIVPRALTLSREWVTKFDGRIEDHTAADADLGYVQDNPHEAWLRRVSVLAGVEYGRIDYGMLGDRPQLWEINTNPTIGANLAFGPSLTTIPPSIQGGFAEDAWRLMGRGNVLFYSKLRAVVEALSRSTNDAMAADAVGSERVRIPISAAQRRRLALERLRRDQVLARKTAIGQLLAPLRAGYRMVRAGRPSPGPSGNAPR